jgi:hypothetical protein
LNLNYFNDFKNKKKKLRESEKFRARTKTFACNVFRETENIWVFVIWAAEILCFCKRLFYSLEQFSRELVKQFTANFTPNQLDISFGVWMKCS